MSGWQALTKAGFALRRAHIQAFETPSAVQEAIFGQVLDSLLGSAFAAGHGLERGMGLAAFRDAVPVRSYDDFRPWLDRLLAGEGRALTARPPVAFELTGGSSGGRKPVPMTAALLNAFRTGLIAWLADLAETWPEITRGRIYFALSPALRHKPGPISGWPVGLDSDLAYFGEDLGPHLARLLLFAPGVASQTDAQAWQTATLAMLLGAEDLSFVSVWSPTFLTALLEALQARPDEALRALADGVAGLEPKQGLARELEKLASRGALTPATIWPGLTLVSAWADAGSAMPFAKLSGALPRVAFQGKGLLATEGLFTLPFAAFPDPVPAILSGLLEFREENGTCLLMHELTPGGEYDLVVSPIGGFARYLIGDRVRMTGWARPGLPMLRFAGRGGSGSDMVGEKLTEAFVLACLDRAGLTGALAARPGPPARYEIITEAPVPPEALEALEAALEDNPQYAYARRLGQLAELHQRTLPDFGARLTARRLAKGHRLSDIKPPVLLSAKVFSDLLATT